MINIILDKQQGLFEIEGAIFIVDGEDSRDQVLKLIEHILNKAYYSGERLCLEIKNEQGYYKEVDRW